MKKKSIFDCSNVISDIKGVIFKPTKFFKSVNNEKDIKRSLMVFISYAVVMLAYNSFSSLILSTFSIFILGVVAFAFIIEFLLIKIYSIFVNISLKLLGTKNTDCKKTASVYFYTSFINVLQIIPFLNVIAVLYRSLYLIPKGLSIKYKVSYVKALAASVLPVIILNLLLLIIILQFFPIEELISLGELESLGELDYIDSKY